MTASPGRAAGPRATSGRQPVTGRRFGPVLLACVVGLTPLTASVVRAGDPATPPTPTGSYRIPYRLTDAKHLLVRARVNDRGPFTFLIDTGAPTLFLRPSAAQKAGIRAGADGWGVLDRLEIEGGAVLRDARARVEEPPQIKGMNALGLAGVELDGLLGYEILAHYRIEIDLTRNTMQWTPSTTPPLPLPAAGDVQGVKPDDVSRSQGSLEGLARMVGALAPRLVPAPPAPRGYVGILLTDPETARVRIVLPGSPAARAGLQPGDRIKSAAVGEGGAVPVHNAADLTRAAARLEAGGVLHLTIQRGSQILQRVLRAGKDSL